MPLQVGKIPIVVPRKYEFNEHVNDHQVNFVGIDDHIKTIKETTNVTVEDELNFLKQIRALTNDNPDYNFKDISG